MWGYLVLGIVLISPLFLTGATELLFLVMTTGVLISSFLFLVRKEFPGHWRLPMGAFVGFCLWALVTLVPVPFFLLKVLSPGLHDMLGRLGMTSAHSLSWDPIWTARTLAVYIAASGLVLVAHFVTDANRPRLPLLMNLVFWPGVGFAAYSLIAVKFLHTAHPLPLAPLQPWNFGLFTNSNVFGSYCVLLIPIGVALLVHALHKLDEQPGLAYLYLPGLGILGVSLYYSYSLGAMAALIASGAVYVLFRKPVWAVGGAVVLLAGLALIQPIIEPQAPESLALRLHADQLALSLWVRMPLSGSGLGTVELAAPALQMPIRDSIVDKIHNDYLELLATGGILGVLLFAGVGIWIFGRLALLRKAYTLRGGLAVGLLAIAIHSLVDFPLQNFSAMGMFCIALGMLSAFQFTRPFAPLRRLKIGYMLLLLAAGAILSFQLWGLWSVSRGTASVWQVRKSLPLIRHDPKVGERMVRQHALYAPAWGELARAYGERNELDKSVAAIEKACLLQPQNAFLHLAAAKQYYLTGLDDRIVPALIRAFSILPSKGILEIPLSLRERETVVFSALPLALKNYGPKAEEFYSTAYLFLSWWKSSRIFEMLRMARQDLPRSHMLANDLAFELLQAGDNKGGLEEAKRGFALSPNARSCLLAARANARLGRGKDTLDWLTRGLALNTGKNAWFVLEGASYLKPFSPEESLRLLKAGYNSDPDHWTAYSIATMFWERHELWNAAEWYEKAIQTDPSFAPAYRSLIEMYNQAGEKERAASIAKQARLHCPAEKW
jgi:tetratricopeptide (TPR) repeat protein